MTPTRGTSYSACLDLRFCPSNDEVKGYDVYNEEIVRHVDPDDRSITILPADRLLLPTGLIFKIDADGDSDVELNQYSIRIHARSGLALKRGLVLANAEGIVDLDYQKEIFVLMTNISNYPQMIDFQERIAQVEVVRNEILPLSELANPPTQYSERSGGFGSTGIL